VTVGQPVFGLAECALLEEVPIVFGAGIIAETLQIPSPISKQRSDNKADSENEGNGADEEHGIREMEHCVLLFAGCPQRPKRSCSASSEPEESLKLKEKVSWSIQHRLKFERELKPVCTIEQSLLCRLRQVDLSSPKGGLQEAATRIKGDAKMIIILIIVLILVFGGGGGYYGYGRWGTGGGAGIGLGTVLVILLICWLLGAFR
jgi:hypothetical protein